MKNLLLFLLLSIITQTASFAQQHYEIKVLAKNKSGKIWLRWAPDNPVVWRLGNQYGYHIERFDLLENGKMIEDVASRGIQLTSSPVKPYALPQMEELSNTDERAVVLIETIYNQGTDNEITSPADIMQQKNELENSFGFALFVCDLSTQLAQAAGLFFEDVEVETGHRYAYRISLAHQPEGMIVEPVVITIDSKPEEPLTKIQELEANFADRKVTLAWPEMKYYGVYSSYFIQKSTDGKSFENLSELPYVHVSNEKELNYQYFVDSLPDNTIEFYYRIIGLTPFGEKGEPSNVVSGSGIDALFGAVYIDTVYFQQDESVIQFRTDAEVEDEIGNIYVASANNPKGPFVPLHKKPLKTGEAKYVDNNAGYNQYYVVQYENKESNKKYQSFPYLAQKVDNSPPQVPTLVRGTIDSTGNVHLNWQPGNDEDLLGYRVFAAHSLNDEYIEVTQEILPGPEFQEKISLNNLTKNTYYKIIAVDKRFNTSDYSPPLQISKPDILPPAAPVFTEERATESGILLKWISSGSDDVARYEIRRKATLDVDWKMISEWNADLVKDSIIDNHDLKFAQTYLYQLVAIDSSGNKSVANSIPVFYSINNRRGATNLIGKINHDKQSIIISWECQEAISGFQIYRASDSGPWQLYQTAISTEQQFIDSNLQISTQYKYRIKLRYRDGLFSELSKPLEIKF